MGLSHPLFFSGLVPCRTLLARIRRGHRCGLEGSGSTSTILVSTAATRLVCCGHHGRPLSAPLTGDVARKARRAEGSPSDYDPSTFPTPARISSWSSRTFEKLSRCSYVSVALRESQRRRGRSVLGDCLRARPRQDRT